jgi:hypothetical protein
MNCDDGYRIGTGFPLSNFEKSTALEGKVSGLQALVRTVFVSFFFF